MQIFLWELVQPMYPNYSMFVVVAPWSHSHYSTLLVNVCIRHLNIVNSLLQHRDSIYMLKLIIKEKSTYNQRSLHINLMNQQPVPSSDRQIQIKTLTSALINVLGVNKQDQSGKIQSATIFMSKLYSKHSTQIGKKFSELKLPRLNGLIYKVCKDPPKQAKDIQLIYNFILSFLNNQGASPIDQNSFSFNTCIWIAQFIQQVLALHLSHAGVQIIYTLLKEQKPTLMTPQKFIEAIEKSNYFKDKQIGKQDEIQSNQKYVYRGFMSEYSILDQIAKNLKPALLFSNLYAAHENKSEILKLFISFCRQFEVNDLQQTFISVFVDKKIQTKQTLLGILTCLDSQFFTADDFNQILKLLLNSNDKTLFYSIPLKSLKCQNRYLEILLDYIKPNVVDELAQTFINEKQVNNYYLIYLINKSNQKLSQKFISLPLDATTKTVTNRMGIICALSISHNPQIAHNKILQFFFDHQSSMSNKQKLDCLKILHFSYLNAPKSHLFTYIIKNISLTALDQQSNFEFLPRGNYEKIQLDKNQRQQLSDFLSRYFGNTDDVFWIKIDLYASCGKQIPYMQDFKKVQKIFENPIDQIVANLETVDQNLLEIVLMGVNNKLSEQFVVNQNGINPVIMWGLEVYKKQQKKFKALAENQLKRNNYQQLLELCLEILYYNMDEGQNIELDDALKIITSPQVTPKLNGLNFSEYFMANQTEKVQNTSALLKSKHILIQLKKLIKALKNDAKTQNRKQLKTLVSQQLGQLRALRIIKLLSVLPPEKLKNTDKLKIVTQRLLKSIKPEFQNFKQLSTRSNNVNINYVPIHQSLQFLLKTNYEATISFLAQLLKSNQIKVEEKEKEKSKKSKKKADQAKQKNIEGIIQNIEYCFRGDPNLLQTYKDIICIIESIKSGQNNQNLSEQLIRWISKIKMFHKQEYKQWKQKVQNYIKLWEAIQTVVSNSITLNEVERHFLMTIDLLNTLYEKHRQEEGFLQVEKRLLNGLYILYILAIKKSDEDKMINEQQIQVPKQRLNQIMANSQLSLMVTPHTYYCYDCSKTICHECAEMIHKQHDKSYTGIKNYDQCHKGSSSLVNLQQQGDRRKEKQMTKLIREGNYRQAVTRERERERERERQRQSLQNLMQIGNYQKLSSEQIDQIYKRVSQKERGTYIHAEPAPQLEEELQKKKSDIQENLEKFQIKSCSEKQFMIKTSNSVNNNKKPSPTFECISMLKKQKNSKLNLNPLFMLLIRELKSYNFYTTPTNVKETDQKLTLGTFQAQLSIQKYSLLREDNFKNNRNISYYGNLDNNTANIKQNNRKNAISINEKYLSIMLTNSANGQNNHTIYHFETRNIKTRFLKKIAQQRYKQTQNSAAFQPITIRINEPHNQMYQIALSSFHSTFAAYVLQKKIIFQNIVKDPTTKLTLTDVLRAERPQRGQSKKDMEIVKFQWFKTQRLKNYYTYLTNEIKIGKLIKKQISHVHSISLAGKTIKDYSIVSVNGKTIIVTILDSESRLYRAKLEISKKLPNFIEHELNCSFSEQIVSITCHSTFVFCVTSNGKIIMMNLNQQNKLATEPIVYPILQNLKTSELATTYNKVKEATKITKLQFICRSRTQLHLSCILAREAGNDPKKSGFFTLINLNINNKKVNSKLTLFSDNGAVDSYDYLQLNDKQYLFTCLQDDGEIWLTKHSIQSKSNENFYDFEFKASLNSVNQYAEQIKRLGLFDKIEFYNTQRRPTFKEHAKLEAQIKTNIGDTFIKVDANQRNLRGDFPTGIQLQYQYNSQQHNNNSAQLVITFLGNTYRYEITKSRQIQLPFTIKESLGLYLGVYQFKIDFLEGKTSNVKNVIVYGVKWTERSPYFKALTNLCKMIYVYNDVNEPVTQYGLQNYFYNQYRHNLNFVRLNEFESYLKKKKFKTEQQNLLMKLQLLRQSIELNRNDDSIISQCYESIRNHVLPNCEQKKQLAISVKKLCNKLTESAKDENIWKLGHALNYNTQLDLYNIFETYKTFRMERSIDSYQDLINQLCGMLNNHTLNAFIVFSVHPEMVKSIGKFFKRVMSKYKEYFSAKEHGLDKDQKLRLTKMCNNMMRIIIQNYQLQKNKDSKTNSQNEFLKTLEGIFCLKNKQVHRQIKLNPFEFLKTTFEEGIYRQQNPPLNYLKVEEVNIYEAPQIMEESNMVEEQKRSELKEVVQNQQGNALGVSQASNIEIDVGRDNEIDYSQSYEEHKEQEEQNREMEQYEYAQQLQAQGNIIAEKITDEDSECLDNDENDEKSEMSELNQTEMNTKKIYQYLLNCCSSKMTDEEVKFRYHYICENLLLQIFGTNSSNGNKHKYLTSKNLVFYVGLVYNILQIVEKKIANLFGNSGHVDFSHPYIAGTVFHLIESIDSKIDNVPHSVLYLPINTIVANNQKNKNGKLKSLFAQCVNEFYRLNMPNTKLLVFMKSSAWHPQHFKSSISLSSVLKLEYFDIQNPIYQIKYVGNLYLNLRSLQIPALIAHKQQIKQNILKVVVKYNLRVYQKIMVIQNWIPDLEHTKISVAFEQLKISSRVQSSLKTMIKCINKDIKAFVNLMNKSSDRLNQLESLLGSDGHVDELVMEILDTYYNFEQKS